MTRWHEDDLGGRILERERARWDVVELPMEALANDPLGRKPGERLWPEWFTDDMLEVAKRDSRSWHALYQQQPSSEEGSYFRREWLKHWKARPAELHVYGTSDYAVTDGGGDYTVHRVWGVAPNGDLYRLDGWRGQTSADEWIEAKLDLMARHKPLAWFGEAGVIQKAVQPMLTRRMRERRVFCRMEWLPSISDKPTRARGFQARAAMGAVYFEPGADIEEFIRFPAGKHDDDVDTASMIGRALDEAHPAIAARPEVRVKPDRYARAFGELEDEGEGWKTA
jgi:predicted phage terminase large subunit-like protein